MDAVDWTALSVFAAIVLGAIGYLAREMHRLSDRMDRGFERLESRIDGVEQRLSERIDRLEERYIRHLEAHATH